MKALQFSRTGDLDSLELVELPDPAPAQGEVLVQIKAAGLNPSDVKNVLGRFPYTTLPRVPGRDFSSTVVDGPVHLLGKDVWGTGNQIGFSRNGSHAGYIALSAQGVALKPDALTHVQAASLGVPYTTAWDALERSQVGAGTRLVVIGANGAVGSAAIALARVRGAHVLAAVRRPEQLKALEERGFDTIVLSTPETLAAQVNAHYTGGADVVFDTTGFWLPGAVSALAPFGRIAIIAAPVDGHVQLPALALYRKGGSVVGINSLLYSVDACARMLEQFGQWFDEGLLPLPSGLIESPLHEGMARYTEVNQGRSDKIILLP